MQKPQAYLAAVFCLATLITTLNANGLPLLEFDNERYRAHLTSAAALGALPGTAVFFTLLRACCPRPLAPILQPCPGHPSVCGNLSSCPRQNPHPTSLKLLPGGPSRHRRPLHAARACCPISRCPNLKPCLGQKPHGNLTQAAALGAFLAPLSSSRCCVRAALPLIRTDE